MEILEILADAYIALGSVFNTIMDRFKNYNHLLSISTIGNDSDYQYLMSNLELKETIIHQKNAHVLLIDEIIYKDKYAILYCKLLNAHSKYTNSITLKIENLNIPYGIRNVPQKWIIK